MRVQEWMAMAITWLVAGPAFVAVLRAMGFRYRVRPSLPVGLRMRASRKRIATASRSVRTHAARLVRSRVEAATPQSRLGPPPPLLDERLWWNDGLEPTTEVQPEARAGD